MSQMIWISAGGTGGHIYPAIAIYEMLLQKNIRVRFIGGKESMEAKICHEKNIHFHATHNLKWLGFSKIFLWLWRLCLSLIDLLKLRHKDKPSAVLIMGGYPCITSGLVAILSRTSLYLHEQNAVLGKTNRWMYPFIKKGFCAYQSLIATWPKLMCVGNPSVIQPRQQPRQHSNKTFKILSFGGSGGAKQLNTLMYEVINSNQLDGCEFWHITGHQDTPIKTLSGSHIKVESYNHDIAKAYAWADLAITRSGAMTLTEITLQGIPSLLLPYPYAANDHQKKNAEYFIEVGGAWLCGQTPHEVIEQIKKLQHQPDTYNAMAEAVFKLIPAEDPGIKIVAELVKSLKVV